MKNKFIFFCLLVVCAKVHAISPNDALQRLMSGNERYVNDQLLHPNRTTERRASLTATQQPYAVILGCSDSRVAPEIVFDEGIGDLFVVRVAGNIVGPIGLDSIEFGVGVLGASIVMVLGHENCGAVQAVLTNSAQDFEAIAAKIEPAVRGISKSSKNALEEAIKANVRSVVRQLKNSPVVSKYIEEKKIDIVGGYYQLKTGKVELLK